jgi:hypothetical protein
MSRLGTWLASPTRTPAPVGVTDAMSAGVASSVVAGAM